MILPIKTFRSLFTFLLFILLTNRVHAQLDTIPVNNNKAFLINSKVLNEPRSIWIHLPPDYDTKTQTYPVLYLLDGEGHFKYVSELADYLSSYDRNRIPEMIVVGILNVDRTRDFTPIHSLLFDGKVDAAIEIFKHNIINFPNSWNAYDSMGEAYVIKGDKGLAIENYEKSVSLNPNNDGGKEALKKLRSEK